jgi:hypothetical protein
VPSIFTENNKVVLGDFNYFFDLVLQIGANGASGQELQIVPKNRFRANFLDKGKFIIFNRLLSIVCFHSSFVQVSKNSKLLVLSQY